jgi:flagellar biosynthesis/type III secretory pathway ATPase
VLFRSGRFPAIDVLSSVSRLCRDVMDAGHAAAAERVRALLAAHRDAQDLISVGAYVKGSDLEVDRAVKAMPSIEGYLRQGLTEIASWDQSRDRLIELARSADA